MDAGVLHQAIAAVCPNITGVVIGDNDDRSTWSIQFTDAATDTEKIAAQVVLASFELRTLGVKAEAERRILAAYPYWKQLNLMQDGGSKLKDMTAFRDKIRAASDALESMAPIPVNYTDDKFWR